MNISARQSPASHARLASLWVAPRPLADKTATAGLPAGATAIIRAAAWPIAALLVIHTVFITALNGTRTDDFTTVYSAVRRFLDGQPVYEQAYQHVDPLYLYNPGATLLLTPLGLSANLELSRAAFIVANALAIVLALGILTRLCGHRLDSWVWPVSIALAFATESVTNTLTFSNINGLLLLGLTVFLAAFVYGHRSGRAWPLWLGGVVLGLTIVIKPQFAPLAFLAVVRLDWRTTLSAIAVPAGLNLVAWPITPGASGYLSNLVPYLGQTRDYANSSLAGVQAYFGLADAVYYPLWLICAGLVGITVIVLLRWRYTDITLWALTTSGVLLVGVFFLSSLGQQYYSMWLFPMMFTALLPRSVFHSWPAWLAAALFLAPVTWYSQNWPDAGRWLSFFLGSVGWWLLIVTSAATVLGWLRSQRTSTPAGPGE